MSSKKKKNAAKRHDRRFIAQSGNSPWIPRVAGALGAAALGASAWGYAYAQSFEADEKLKVIPQYLLAGGAVLTGIAIWFGTSSEPPVRVGDPGIGIERGEVRRMPWWAVESITFEPGNLALAIVGRDEAGIDWSFKVPVKSHPDAVGWIVSEATGRIPDRVDISDELREKLPAASPNAGLKIDLEPLQIVGRKCAATGKTISYEPDGRICVRCERVYLKTAVPKKCKCGASLAHLRGEGESDGADGSDDSEADDEKATEAASS